MKTLKTILKTLVVFIPVILIWIYIAAFPGSYMDGEYSYFTQAKDYRMGKSSLAPCDILILGDSRAKSALIPEELSSACVSVAEGGSTAVEAYYTLKDYLTYVGKPEKVVLSISSYHFTSFDGFWTRSVYFDFLSWKQAEEVIKEAGSNKEKEALEAAGGSGLLTLFEYKIKSPTKYMSPVLNSLKEDRKSINLAAYSEMERTRGFKSFVSWWPTSAEHDMEDFVLLKTLDSYYRKTIDLCIENGIEVYSVNTPLISDTYEEAKKISEPFSRYFQELKADYPETEYPAVHIETEFESYDTKYFDDADHLNPEGAKVYTESFKDRYLGKGGAS
ncbi:MAG: hypothetical protein IKE48_03990 [Parasporobacterium sp.]|nr:hypothetical protein [Parasporobacterium sp.]